MRFDAAPLEPFWQFLDRDLLEHDLWRSLYYLHTQPPLFNLFLGVVLKLSPGAVLAQAFAVIYLALGLSLAISIFFTMVRLGVSEKLSSGLAIAFVVSPPCILYENWLYYTYPLTVLLSLSALFLHRFATKTHFHDGLAFFSLLALVVLCRSLFHLLWFALFVMLLAFCKRRRWRTIAAAASAPFLVISLLYVKNWYLFGGFASSSWLGMSLARMTTSQLPESERSLLVSQGRVSALALVRPFRGIRPEFLERLPKTHIPALDRTRKWKGGARNLNHIAYVAISQLYLRDAIGVVRARPETYLRGLLGAHLAYLRPANDYVFLGANRSHIRSWDAFYSKYVCGQLRKAPGGVGLLLLVAFPFLIFHGGRLSIETLSRDNLPSALTLLFIWLNILYVSLVGNALEATDNNRIRFMIDPFYLIVLGMFVSERQRYSDQRRQQVE